MGMSVFYGRSLIARRNGARLQDDAMAWYILRCLVAHSQYLTSQIQGWILRTSWGKSVG